MSRPMFASNGLPHSYPDDDSELTPSNSLFQSRNKQSDMVTSCVGFGNLTNQLHRKSVKRGFHFNLMVMGRSGLGKSTLINSLFFTDLYNADYPGPSKRIKQTVNVESQTFSVTENGTRLSLTVVDTPGFGDAVDNSPSITPLVESLDSRMEQYLTTDLRLSRPPVDGPLDPRIHAALYFIEPTGHGLKPIDIEIMTRLQDKVCLIPLIGKADTLTPEECKDFKKTILNELTQNKIGYYDFPDIPGLGGGDPQCVEDIKSLRSRQPLAVVGSSTFISKGSGRVAARVYPWGTVEVENLEHNDTKALRRLLFNTHMQDLVTRTIENHYERYRTDRLTGIATTSNFQIKGGHDPMLQMEAEKSEHEARLIKMKADMEQVFKQKVREKAQKQQESEEEMEKRSAQMRIQLDAQMKQVTLQYEQFEAERQAWNQANRDLVERVESGVFDSGDKSKTKKKGFF